MVLVVNILLDKSFMGYLNNGLKPMVLVRAFDLTFSFPNLVRTVGDLYRRR